MGKIAFSLTVSDDLNGKIAANVPVRYSDIK